MGECEGGGREHSYSVVISPALPGGNLSIGCAGNQINNEAAATPLLPVLLLLPLLLLLLSLSLRS